MLRRAFPMKQFLIAGAAATALIAGAAVFAQPGAPATAAKGHTRASAQAMVAKQFARRDSNRDGFVTRAEADSAKAARAAKRGDRKADRSGARFDRLDTNRDGSIARAEFEAAQANRRQRMAARDKDGDGRADARGSHTG